MTWAPEEIAAFEARDREDLERELRVHYWIGRLAMAAANALPEIGDRFARKGLERTLREFLDTDVAGPDLRDAMRKEMR